MRKNQTQVQLLNELMIFTRIFVDMYPGKRLSLVRISTSLSQNEHETVTKLVVDLEEHGVSVQGALYSYNPYERNFEILDQLSTELGNKLNYIPSDF